MKENERITDKREIKDKTSLPFVTCNKTPSFCFHNRKVDWQIPFTLCPNHSERLGYVLLRWSDLSCYDYKDTPYERQNRPPCDMKVNFKKPPFYSKTQQRFDYHIVFFFHSITFALFF